MIETVAVNNKNESSDSKKVTCYLSKLFVSIVLYNY